MNASETYYIDPYDEQDFKSLEELSLNWLANKEFWDVDQILKTISHQDVSLWLLKSVSSKELQGMMLVSWTCDFSEILFIYVRAERRGSGGGKKLLDHYLYAAKTKGLHKIFLEVREGNEVARSFYSGYGFNLVSRRHGYYSNGDHALIYEKEI